MIKSQDYLKAPQRAGMYHGATEIRAASVGRSPDKGKHHSHDDNASNSSATSLPGLTVRLSWAQSKAVCIERGRRGGQPGWRLDLCRWTKEDGA